ncbi:MAG TPA: branched-chain amino acid ABC transporter permease, partial [Variovorax sp.]|nr:branched-chain amino acid ABC transporter permease [Variovorax sp.]
MNSTLLLLGLLDGITQAAVLFLVALGMTLIFGVMRILNVAHGSLYAFGGYAAASVGAHLAAGTGSLAVALLALVAGAVAMGLLLGAVIEFALVRRILDMDPAMQLLATFALPP